MAIDPKSAVAMFTFAKDTVKGIFSEKVDERVKEKLQEVLDCIDKLQMSALEKNEMLFSMQHELYELKEQLRSVGQWEDRVSQYELVSTVGNGVVYKFKANPPHYACPACIENKLIHILQDHDFMSGEFVCPGCKVQYPVKKPNFSYGESYE